MLAGIWSGQNGATAPWVVDAFPPRASVFQKKVSSAVGLSPHKMSTGVERWHKGKNVQGIRTVSRLGLALALILGRKADAEIRGAVVTSLCSHGKRKIE